MFSKFQLLGPNHAAAPDFAVCRVDRHTLRYTDGDHVLDIEVEAGQGLAVYLSAVQTWQPPFEVETISPPKREEIAERIGAALRFMRIDHVIE